MWEVPRESLHGVRQYRTFAQVFVEAASHCQLLLTILAVFLALFLDLRICQTCGCLYSQSRQDLFGRLRESVLHVVVSGDLPSTVKMWLLSCWLGDSGVEVFGRRAVRNARGRPGTVPGAEVSKMGLDKWPVLKNGGGAERNSPSPQPRSERKWKLKGCRRSSVDALLFELGELKIK